MSSLFPASHLSSDKGYNNLLLSAESTLDPLMGLPLLMEAASGNGILCLAIYVGSWQSVFDFHVDHVGVISPRYIISYSIYLVGLWRVHFQFPNPCTHVFPMQRSNSRKPRQRSTIEYNDSTGFL